MSPGFLLIAAHTTLSDEENRIHPDNVGEKSRRPVE